MELLECRLYSTLYKCNDNRYVVDVDGEYQEEVEASNDKEAIIIFNKTDYSNN